MPVKIPGKIAAMPADRRSHGWLVIDKPLGMSSHRAVEIVRRRTGAKAGHAGTLDPLATGVLPVALGEATKTVGYAMSARKCYRFRIRWGIARATDDGEGEIVAETLARPSAVAVEAMLSSFTGRIRQSPPAHSAVKVGGRRAYALARANKPPILPERPVEIAALRLIATPDPDHADFIAEVGKGTYIRALARDLAVALGTFGHVAALRRLSVGRFTEAHAIPLESLAEPRDSNNRCDNLLPIETGLDDVPAVVLAAAEAARLRCGQRVMPDGAEARERVGRLAEGTVVSAWLNHALIALARIENSSLQPLRVINL
jgi:tRNA pseudouridine55 synthase